MRKKTKIGLVLGGGGTRGLAHIGALKELAKYNIEISAIAGCSVGAIIGAFYAAGKTIEEIEEFAFKTNLLNSFDFFISRDGFARTTKLERKIVNFIGFKTFKKFKIPLYVNATNISKGRERTFSSGNIFNAIRASISVPGIFSPLKLGGDYYIDGGVLNQIPFSVLPKDITHYIIINATPHEKMTKAKRITINNLLENSLKLMQNKISNLKLESIKKENYVMIEPSLHENNMFESKKLFKDIIKKGEKAVRDKDKKIKKLLR